MNRTIVITIDIDDAAPDGTTYSETDIRDSFLARLDEIPGMDCAVPEKVRVAVADGDSVRMFLNAADVGLEGDLNFLEETETVEGAIQVVNDLRSV